MHDIDLIQTWLDNVAIGHSGSKATEDLYRYHLNCFLKFTEATVESIEKEYDALPEKQFRRKYAQALNAWKSRLMRENYSSGSIAAFITAVKSFFKYSNFQLDFVPAIRRRVSFHNRDITKEEILQILRISAPRERAFYAMMAQSGLRPTTLCMLKLKDLEPDYSQNKIPLLIKVAEAQTKGQYHAYATFVGEDAVKYLKDYWNTRGNLTAESYVFVNCGREEPMVYNTPSSMFRKAIRLLRDKGVMSYEQKQKSRPAEIRLYNLRKWFRKQATQMGLGEVEYMMGHTGPGVDASYRPRDPEFYRAIYAEKAMPFLRLEQATPLAVEEQVKDLGKAYEEKIDQLKAELERTLKEKDAELRNIIERNREDSEMRILLALNRAAEMREKHQPQDLHKIIEDMRQEDVQRQVDMYKFLAEHPEYIWRQDEKVSEEHLEKFTKAFNEYREKIGKAKVAELEKKRI